MKITQTLVAQKTDAAREALKDTGVLDGAQFQKLKSPEVSKAQLEIAGAMVEVAKDFGVRAGSVRKMERLAGALKNELAAKPMLERAEVLHDAGLLTEGAFQRLGDGKVSKISLAEIAFAQKKAPTGELRATADALMDLAKDAADSLPWLSQMFEGWADRKILNMGARSDPHAWAKDYSRISVGMAEF